TFTLSYGNNGGFENGVWIWNEFPSDAPFVWSFPPPDDVDRNGLWARWDIGDLGTTEGDIIVGVAITESVPPSTTIEIWDWIYDHINQEWGSTVITYHVQAPPPVDWRKWVNGVEWSPQLFVTAQTSDTIEVIDVVNSSAPFTLTEFWDPAHLTLLGYNMTAGQVFTGDGMLEWGMDTPGLV
ncbi:MAG: hypothetical protein GY832_42725, partial [Chloroflexi bacterium]|nr:hypothetical protein [Chloroflexota bacterium]